MNIKQKNPGNSDQPRLRNSAPINPLGCRGIGAKKPVSHIDHVFTDTFSGFPKSSFPNTRISVVSEAGNKTSNSVTEASNHAGKDRFAEIVRTKVLDQQRKSREEKAQFSKFSHTKTKFHQVVAAKLEQEKLARNSTPKRTSIVKPAPIFEKLTDQILDNLSKNLPKKKKSQENQAKNKAESSEFAIQKDLFLPEIYLEEQLTKISKHEFEILDEKLINYSKISSLENLEEEIRGIDYVHLNVAALEEESKISNEIESQPEKNVPSPKSLENIKILALKNFNFEHFPDFLLNFEATKILILDNFLGHNKLRLPEYFLAENLTHRFTRLQILKIVNNLTLTELAENFFSQIGIGQNLAFLDLSNNGLAIIKKDYFSSLSGLKFLNLATNKIKAVDNLAFQSLGNLQVLILLNNKITSITDTS